MLETPRLFLVPSNAAMLEVTVAEDWPALSALLGGVTFAEHWLHFPDAMLWLRDYLREFEADAEWWNYFIIRKNDQMLIGTCGFKGPPAVLPEVEIGYEIADDCQNQGFATEAAGALTQLALAHEAVESVLAHTLAEENASVAVLRKLGFVFEGELEDIEEGKVWLWRRNGA